MKWEEPWCADCFGGGYERVALLVRGTGASRRVVEEDKEDQLINCGLIVPSRCSLNSSKSTTAAPN